MWMQVLMRTKTAVKRGMTNNYLSMFNPEPSFPIASLTTLAKDGPKRIN
jgi:hypothetical protein